MKFMAPMQGCWSLMEGQTQIYILEIIFNNETKGRILNKGIELKIQYSKSKT